MGQSFLFYFYVYLPVSLYNQRHSDDDPLIFIDKGTTSMKNKKGGRVGETEKGTRTTRGWRFFLRKDVSFVRGGGELWSTGMMNVGLACLPEREREIRVFLGGGGGKEGGDNE